MSKIFIVGTLMLAAPAVIAKERQTVQQGMGACKKWCDNNRKGNEHTKCYQNCEIYWACNGSDSTALQCSNIKGAFGVAERDPGGKPQPQPKPKTSVAPHGKAAQRLAQ